MGLSWILCAVTGHRWTPTTDASDTNAMFHCERCGRTQVFDGETHRIDKTTLKGDFQRKTGQFGGPRG